MYVRAGRMPPGESAVELTHPFPFARYIPCPMLPPTPNLSSFPTVSLPQQNKNKNKKRDLVSLTTCHLLVKYGGGLPNFFYILPVLFMLAY